MNDNAGYSVGSGSEAAGVTAGTVIGWLCQQFGRKRWLWLVAVGLMRNAQIWELFGSRNE